MWNRAIFLIALPLEIFAQTARVPFVGCESLGQVALNAPKGNDYAVQAKESIVRKLSYYEAPVAPGVLAPRGWHCIGLNGSSGYTLYVTADPMSGPQGEITGPVVEVDFITADNGSGRYDIAQVLGRVFPGQRAFVQSVIDGLGLPGTGGLTFRPFPKDKLIVQTDRVVQFQTPPHSEGLGTISWLQANDDPIDGVAIFEGPAPHLLPDLVLLRVRLPRELRYLAPVIIHDLLVRQRSDTR